MKWWKPYDKHYKHNSRQMHTPHTIPHHTTYTHTHYTHTTHISIPVDARHSKRVGGGGEEEGRGKRG